MLFYNHNQEFLGIDEEGLKLLNYGTFDELLAVCSDVADLFAKEPGYIHNFKSFGWINFLLHAESDARSAIVHGNGRTFSCTLEVQKLFLTDEPSSPGFMIDMAHIQSISGEELKPHTITPKTIIEAPQSTLSITEPKTTKPALDILPDYGDETPLNDPGTLDIPDTYEATNNEITADHFEDIYKQHTPPPVETIESPRYQVPPISNDLKKFSENYSPAEQEFLNKLKVDKNYRFDPTIAANELGLPVDLIQEFIGDFILQAHDFKEELFQSVLKGDMNNLKILSHKLKGVAANLRIEDAFESLAIINTSSEPVEIEANLKYLYTIVDKLEGKQQNMPSDDIMILEPKAEEPSIVPLETKINDDEIYSFDLKQDTDEPLLVQESELSHETEPEKIEEAPTALFQEDESIEESAVASEDYEELQYNSTATASSLGIDSEFMAEMVEDYKKDALSSAESINLAVNAFETYEWQKIAKRLKGISDNLQITKVSEQLAILKETNDAQEAHKASKRLDHFLSQL